MAIGLLSIVMIGLGYLGGLLCATTTRTVVNAAVPVIDTEELMNGKISVYDGRGDIQHFAGVVEYLEGDPGSLYPLSTDELATFAVVTGSGEVENYVVLADGKVEKLQTKFRRLRRNGQASSFKVFETQNGGKVIAQPQLDNTFVLTAAKEEGAKQIFIVGAVDWCVAYDTIYWMEKDSSTVWCINWLEPNPEKAVYCENAYAVSHHTDEAEGAIVPIEQANYTAYGRHDILSPYGRK